MVSQHVGRPSESLERITRKGFQGYGVFWGDAYSVDCTFRKGGSLQ